MSHSEHNVGQTTRIGSSNAASTAPKRAAAHPITMAPEERTRMIAELAYFKAERRGFLGGNPEQDWYDAERETDELLAEPARRRARSQARSQREGQRRRRHREA